MELEKYKAGECCAEPTEDSQHAEDELSQGPEVHDDITVWNQVGAQLTLVVWVYSGLDGRLEGFEVSLERVCLIRSCAESVPGVDGEKGQDEGLANV